MNQSLCALKEAAVAHSSFTDSTRGGKWDFCCYFFLVGFKQKFFFVVLVVSVWIFRSIAKTSAYFSFMFCLRIAISLENGCLKISLLWPFRLNHNPATVESLIDTGHWGRQMNFFGLKFNGADLLISDSVRNLKLIFPLRFLWC